MDTFDIIAILNTMIGLQNASLNEQGREQLNRIEKKLDRLLSTMDSKTELEV